MKTRRSEVWLSTKTHDRSYDGSMKLLEESLKSLQTDHLDTWQLHNIKTKSELDQIFSDSGAIKALEKAKSEGMVRYLGITGHFEPLILLEAIKRFPFDQILLAVNAADVHYLSFKKLPSSRSTKTTNRYCWNEGSNTREDAVNMDTTTHSRSTCPDGNIKTRNGKH